jgi:hypothetical protein
MRLYFADEAGELVLIPARRVVVLVVRRAARSRAQGGTGYGDGHEQRPEYLAKLPI